MGYNISSLAMRSLTDRKYFFDANLWLIFLKENLSPSPQDKKYLDFFETFKTHIKEPKIVITSLVLSEVINRYLRDVAMSDYIKLNKIPEESINRKFYKEKYRKEPHFREKYASICEEIKTFDQIYELVPDDLGSKINDEILTSPPTGLDFNDYYFYQLAKHNKYIIVTDDADFFVEDVEVLTYNTRLIQKAKDAVIPKKQ